MRMKIYMKLLISASSLTLLLIIMSFDWLRSMKTQIPNAPYNKVFFMRGNTKWHEDFGPVHCEFVSTCYATVCHHGGLQLENVLAKEHRWIELVQHWLDLDKDLTFIDIGAGIGLYSLAAAGIGHKVLAIEPQPDNFKLLRMSVSLSYFKNPILTVRAALSDGRHDNMSLETDASMANRTLLRKGGCIRGENVTCLPVRTSRLDDLLLARVTLDTCVMHIDIEGQEMPVMMAGRAFWGVVHVPVVLMGWQWVSLLVKNGLIDDAKVFSFFDFMMKMGYRHRDADGVLLTREQWQTWPEKIVWIKHGFDNKFDNKE